VTSCLRKNAPDRATANELLKSSFISETVSSPRHPASIFKPGNNHDFEDDDCNDFHEFGFSDLTSSKPSLFKSEDVANDSHDNIENDENSIIYSIRLEHLDRLLQKFVDKLNPDVLQLESGNEFSMSVDREEFSRSVDSADNLFQSMEDAKYSNQEKKAIEELKDSGEKSGTQSILKSSIRSHQHLDHSDNKAPPALSFNSKNATDGSLRSVHFQEDPPDSKSSAPAGKTSLRSRLNLKELSLEVVDSPLLDYVEHPPLPKTSSYFAHTKKPAIDGAIANETAESRQSLIRERIEELKAKISKFDEKGIRKWRNLSSQLNLPLHVVLIAVKSKLGHLIDLHIPEMKFV
jgi:hypothetical protein